jgi:hypothetical protein
LGLGGEGALQVLDGLEAIRLKRSCGRRLLDDLGWELQPGKGGEDGWTSVERRWLEALRNRTNDGGGVQAMTRDRKGGVPGSIGLVLAQATLATHFYIYIRVFSHFLAST